MSDPISSSDWSNEPGWSLGFPVQQIDPPRAQMVMSLRDGNGAPLSYDPRAVLERVLARFDELSLTPVCAHELEFYIVDIERDDAVALGEQNRIRYADITRADDRDLHRRRLLRFCFGQ